MAIDPKADVVSKCKDVPEAAVAAGAESTDVVSGQPNVEDGDVEAESNDVVPAKSNVEDADVEAEPNGFVPDKSNIEDGDVVSSPHVAVVGPGAVAATSTKPKQRRSSPLDIAVASGEAPHYKDQVTDASPYSEKVNVEDSSNNNPEKTALPDIRIQKEQFYSRVNVENENNVEETCTNSTSQLQHQEQQLDLEDQTRTSLLLQANQVAETDEERRRRVLGEVVGTAEVLDRSYIQLSSRKRASWCVALLAILTIIGVVAGITASRSSKKANDSEGATSSATETPPSPQHPTAAPTAREPAEVVLQLAIGNEMRNGEILMDLYDGALVDVDEFGTDLFAVIANASLNVRSVLFDNGVVEKDRPFSRCKSTRAFGVLGCVEMRERGFYTIWAIPYPDRSQNGVPWPAVNITIEIIGELG